MTFSELLTSIKALKVSGDAETEILGLCYDSRQVQAGGLFFALRGSAVDGHRFIGTAVRNGASAVVAEDDSAVPAGIPFAKVADARLAMSLMAALFYGNPTDRLPLIGITGTNGKTTASYIIEAILEEAGIPAALLGTVAYRFRERVFPAPHTTPESVDTCRVEASVTSASRVYVKGASWVLPVTGMIASPFSSSFVSPSPIKSA